VDKPIETSNSFKANRVHKRVLFEQRVLPIRVIKDFIKDQHRIYLNEREKGVREILPKITN
jgi:hypothetical protein